MHPRSKYNQLTNAASSMASVAPMIKSSTQLWSQYKIAKRESMYNTLAGSALRSIGLKSVMSDWKMSGNA